MLLETMSSEKAQHLSIKALRLLGRKEATWSLKPKGRKSTGDCKNQKRNREAAGEGPHPWKQRVKIRKSQQPESYLRAKQEQQHLYHKKKKRLSKNCTPDLIPNRPLKNIYS
jgi:alpha/beta superfamily hydrolase